MSCLPFTVLEWNCHVSNTFLSRILAGIMLEDLWVSRYLKLSDFALYFTYMIHTVLQYATHFLVLFIFYLFVYRTLPDNGVCWCSHGHPPWTTKSGLSSILFLSIKRLYILRYWFLFILYSGIVFAVLYRLVWLLRF